MRRLNWHRQAALVVALLGISCGRSPTATAAETLRLAESNWDAAVPEGKEVDSIYGDWVLRNDHIVAVIGDALESRNANMTVRNVGGAVIDLTPRDRQSDQLSAYYPLGAKYQLAGPFRPDGTADEQAGAQKGASVTLRFRGPSIDKRTSGEVIYTLDDSARWLKIVTRVTNVSDEPWEVRVADAIRADGEFEFGQNVDQGLFWAQDVFWQQAYGALLADPASRFAVSTPKKGDRPELPITAPASSPAKLAKGETHETVRYVFPAAHLLDVQALAAELRGQPLLAVELQVNDPAGAVAAADVHVKNAKGEQIAQGRSDEKGKLMSRLPAGKYQATVSAQGREEKNLSLDVAQAVRQTVELSAPGYVVAAITDIKQQPIACKVQFRGKDKTADPNFGPDSAIHGVRNAYYSANGQFRVEIAPGDYDVIVSYGPEFDAVFTSINVARGKETALKAELKRTVDTSGWLSADFHSHSTPSGDNTCSQRGRVLNLLAEHIEFAPCTEHNRITVYDPHLAHFAATDRMLSCPGMELTGRPLPINHQNAFPLTPHPRTQDGGAPLSDVDPVVQIERLAMWENASDKLVQINHPNLVQMIGDKDLNGSPDGGFEKMFGFMDVIEVHPLDRIFTPLKALPAAREEGNTIFNWLQMINLGYRVPGVVNTDAHWNFHGSGFLRNYIKSSTDEPTKASVLALAHACEHGNIAMTNGPFLEVYARDADSSHTVTFGDDFVAPEGKLNLRIKVQCPNWLEVNRVQIFVNGKPDPKWNLTRRTHADKFHQATVVFDEDLAMHLPSDAHLVVAVAGEGKELGPVMGPEHGKDMPVAVGNPIFVDVDGDGFKPNGDMLGIPLPIAPDHKPSKPHKHTHPHKHPH